MIGGIWLFQVLAFRFLVGSGKVLFMSGVMRVLVSSVVWGNTSVVMPVKVDL